MKWFKLNKEMLNLEHISCFKIEDTGDGNGKVISFYFGDCHRETLRYCNDSRTSELYEVLIKKIESMDTIIDIRNEIKHIEASYSNDT